MSVRLAQFPSRISPSQYFLIGTIIGSMIGIIGSMLMVLNTGMIMIIMPPTIMMMTLLTG